MGRRRSLQFLNPLTIIGLAIYIFAASSLGHLPLGGRCELRSRRRARAYPLKRAARLAADGWHCDDRRRRLLVHQN